MNLVWLLGLKGETAGKQAESQGMERLHPVAFGWSRHRTAPVPECPSN